MSVMNVVCCQRPQRRADHPSRGVVTNMRKPRLTTAAETWGGKEILCGIFTASSIFRGSLRRSILCISRINKNFNVLVDDKKT